MGLSHLGEGEDPVDHGPVGPLGDLGEDLGEGDAGPHGRAEDRQVLDEDVGEDELDREPVWWYQVRFDAPGPIRALKITNSILFEVFDDQSNVLRVVKFPEEDRRAYYFAHGEESVRIEF